MLTRLWRWLFGGCEHQWETISESNVWPVGSTVSEGIPTGFLFVLRCKHCGNIKHETVRP